MFYTRTTKAIETNYYPHDGLFDLHFTDTDISIVIMILTGAFVSVYYQFKDDNAKNPNFFDIVFTVIISYSMTAGLFELCIAKDIQSNFLMLVMLIFSSLSLKIMNYINSSKASVIFENIFKGLVKNIVQVLNNRITKWDSKQNTK